MISGLLPRLAASSLFIAFTVVAVLAVCSEPSEPTVATPAPTSAATSAASGSTPSPPTPTATASAETAASPSPAASATADPACPGGRDDSVSRLAGLELAVRQAMAGYPGSWGVALRDLGCATALAVNPDYAQYPASAGKIVTVIAALREAEAGRVPIEAVWDQVVGIMTYSWDEMADALTGRLSAAAVQEVLSLAGASPLSRFELDWRHAHMTALDLALVWEALVEGELLDAELTERLLALAAAAQIPPSLETFPATLDQPGLQYGQKAGYYVSDGLPYFLVGAGYLVATDPGGPRFVMVLMLESLRQDLNDPQRRSVFELLLAYALGEG